MLPGGLQITRVAYNCHVTDARRSGIDEAANTLLLPKPNDEGRPPRKRTAGLLTSGIVILGAGVTVIDQKSGLVLERNPAFVIISRSPLEGQSLCEVAISPKQ